MKRMKGERGNRKGEGKRKRENQHGIQGIGRVGTKDGWHKPAECLQLACNDVCSKTDAHAEKAQRKRGITTNALQPWCACAPMHRPHLSAPPPLTRAVA